MKSNLVIGILVIGLLAFFFQLQSKKADLEQLEDQLYNTQTKQFALNQSLKSLEEKHAKLEGELRAKRLIPASKITDWLDSKFSEIDSNMVIYREQFKIVLEQVHWYHETMHPYIKEYSGYVQKAIKYARFLPISLPYMHEVLYIVKRSVSYSEKFVSLTSDYRDFDLEMRSVARRYQSYQEDKENRRNLVALQQILSGDYIQQLRKFQVLLLELEQAFAYTSDTLRSIKTYKKTVQDTSNKFLGPLNFLGGSSKKPKMGNLFRKKDKLESMINFIKKHSDRFSQATATIRARMTRDIESITIVEAGVGILETSLPEF